ncbi:hypothetical protein R6Z07F_016705 [Ovis aries]
MLLAPWSPSAEILATTNQVCLKSSLNMFVFSKHRKQERSLAARRPHREERGRTHPLPLASLLSTGSRFLPGATYCCACNELHMIRTDAGAPILWPPGMKSCLFGKDPDAGKDRRQEEKGVTEDETVGWHH